MDRTIKRHHDRNGTVHQLVAGLYLLLLLGALVGCSLNRHRQTTATPSSGASPSAYVPSPTPTDTPIPTRTPTPTPSPLPAGDVWSTNVRVSYTGSEAHQGSPSIVVDEKGIIYLVWCDNKDGDRDIFFSKSTDGGLTWSQSVQVNEDPFSTRQDGPVIGIDSRGNLYVMWYDWRDSFFTEPDIYLAKSMDGGGTWSTNIKVNDRSGTMFLFTPPLLLTDEKDNLYAVWTNCPNMDCNIYFSRSGDRGMSWLANMKVNSSTEPLDKMAPSMSMDAQGNLYVAWQESTSDKHTGVFFSKSADRGMSWFHETQIGSRSASSSQHFPEIAADGAGKLHILWVDVQGGKNNLYYAASANHGITWIPGKKINDDNGLASHSHPVLRTDDDGNLYAIWHDRRNGDADIYFTHSTDGGHSWLPNVRVNDDGGSDNQVGPTIAVGHDGILYAAWMDERNSAYAIYFASSRPMTARELAALPSQTPRPTPIPTRTPVPTTPPEVLATANCPNPQVRIISPPPDATIRGRVRIRGMASIDRFQYYKIEFWPSNGSGWQFLLKRDHPVTNGELMMLDTGTVPPGRYGMRLQVVDITGNYPEPCEIWWTIAR